MLATSKKIRKLKKIMEHIADQSSDDNEDYDDDDDDDSMLPLCLESVQIAAHSL